METAGDRIHKFFPSFAGIRRPPAKAIPGDERKKFKGSNRRAAPTPLRCRPLGPVSCAALVGVWHPASGSFGHWPRLYGRDGSIDPEGAGQALASQHFDPLFERQIRGDDEAGAFISPADHVEEQFGTGLGRK